MKEDYIKLPNITVSKLQDVVDYLDKNNIEYIEDYKEEVELNKYKEVLNKIKEYIEENKLAEIYYDLESLKPILKHYIDADKILELLEEIE